MNRTLARQYTKLVDFLSKTLGPDYEIALHDLTDKNKSIIALANGHISGRTLGAPLTDMALEIISEKSYEELDYQLNYSGISVNNRALRSSTMFIKDDTGKMVGMLCINFDDYHFQELSTRLFQLCHPDEFLDRVTFDSVDKFFEADEDEEDEAFYSSISDTIDEALAQVVQDSNVPANRLTQDEKLHVVERLEEKGVFRLKGAVSHVAQRLCCSRASIYRYLSKIQS